MPGVRGFSANPNVQREAPTLKLDEAEAEDPWRRILEEMDLEQCQQIFESLSDEQKEQLAAHGLAPDVAPDVATMCRHVELRGEASHVALEGLLRGSRQLRGLAPLDLQDAGGRLRPAEPTLHALSECGDPRCGAHRLNFPQVRQRFRSFVLRSIRRSAKDAAWWRDGLIYASLGSGHLLWDCEILDRIRAEGVEVRQICLIDVAYAKPDDLTLLVLQTFADWQAASAELCDEPAPQVLAFPSAQAYWEQCGEGGVAAGCNLFMHCDAAWPGSDEECQRLAEKALVPSGLLARLNNLGGKKIPEEMLQKGPQMLRKYWQVQQEHSEEPFSAGAWLSHGEGDLEPLQDYLLGADPEEKALQQLETDQRFKQAERARAEDIGLEVWRVRCLDPVRSRHRASAEAPSFGQFAAGEVLIAAERNGDWIRVAGTADLWGVHYSLEAKIQVAQAPHSGELSQPADDSSVWVPIDGSCLGLPHEGRFLEQIYVPPGRDPWTPQAAAEPSRHHLSVQPCGAVTLTARCRRGDVFEAPRCWRHVSGSRARQRERLHWRAVLHESCGNRTAMLTALRPEERARLRAFLKKEQHRWKALAMELSQLRGFARRERLAQLSIEDRSNFQQWLLDQKVGQKAPTH